MAIKHIPNSMGNVYEGLKVLREVQLLRHLNRLDTEGKFVTRLLDIRSYPAESKDSSDSQGSTVDLFLVMEHISTDLRKLLDSGGPSLSEQ